MPFDSAPQGFLALPDTSSRACSCASQRRAAERDGTVGLLVFLTGLAFGLVLLAVAAQLACPGALR